jgi:Zn finger protein HypA/HybF involved in hydrogenase expression
MSIINTIGPEEFKKLLSESKTIADFAAKLGCCKTARHGAAFNPCDYKMIKRKCIEFGIDYNSITNRSKVSLINNTQLIEAVKNNRSIRGVILYLKLKGCSGSMHAAIKQKISMLGIDASHFTAAKWSEGKNRFNDETIARRVATVEIKWDEAFKKGSSVSNESLIKRLVAAGKREYKCVLCGINKWSGKPLRLRLDHIDGDCINNEEANLRLLCPNCDSQTDTFCRGKKDKNHDIQWWQYIVDPENFSKKVFIKEHFLDDNNKDCRHQPKLHLRKVLRPTKEELSSMITSMSWSAIGRKYGVSDNAVRKWAKWYGLATK